MSQLSPKALRCAAHRPEFPAYEAYLKSLLQFSKQPETLIRGKEHFTRAAALDCHYAPPHLALGQGYVLVALHGVEPPESSCL